MNKIDLALEVVKQGMTGTARMEANKIIENALKPELTSGEVKEVEKEWLRYSKVEKEKEAWRVQIYKEFDQLRHEVKMLEYDRDSKTRMNEVKANAINNMELRVLGLESKIGYLKFISAVSVAAALVSVIAIFIKM
jgi:hypothetical protein